MNWQTSLVMIFGGLAFCGLGIWQGKRPDWVARANMERRPWTKRTLADFRRDAILGGYGTAIGSALITVVGVILLIKALV